MVNLRHFFVLVPPFFLCMESLSYDILHGVIDAVFDGAQVSYDAFCGIMKAHIRIMTVCKTWKELTFICIEARIQQRLLCMLDTVDGFRLYEYVQAKFFDYTYSIQKLSKVMTVNKNVKFLHRIHMNGLDAILPDEQASMHDVCIFTYNLRRNHELDTICLVYCPSLEYIEQWKNMAKLYGLNAVTQSMILSDDCDIVIGTYKYMQKKRMPERFTQRFLTVFHQYEKFPNLVTKITSKMYSANDDIGSIVYITNVLTSFLRSGFCSRLGRQYYVPLQLVKEGANMRELMGPRWNHVQTDIRMRVIQCLCAT